MLTFSGLLWSSYQARHLGEPFFIPFFSNLTLQYAVIKFGMNARLADGVVQYQFPSIESRGSDVVCYVLITTAGL